jgi:hypothetical protein
VSQVQQLLSALFTRLSVVASAVGKTDQEAVQVAQVVVLVTVAWTLGFLLTVSDSLAVTAPSLDIRMAVVVVVAVRQQLVLMLLERQVETVAQAKTSLRFLVKQAARLSKAVVVVVAQLVVRLAQAARVVALTATHLPMRRRTQPQAVAVALSQEATQVLAVAVSFM